MTSAKRSDTLATTWRNIQIVSAALLIFYVTAIASYSHAGFPSSMTSTSRWPWLVDKPVGEDGYYMLTVADNIAKNGHIQYNGGIEATGIQPLATLVFAQIDWMVHRAGGSSGALIKSVMVFGCLLQILFAWQIRQITTSISNPTNEVLAGGICFILVIFSFTLFRLFTYGLETGIYLVLIALAFGSTQRISMKGATSSREALFLGLASGLAGLARIDFGLLLAVLLIFLLGFGWISWKKAAVVGGLALTIVSPWFWFVHNVSGSWLPSSGKAESTLISQSTLAPRCWAMLVALSGNLFPWAYGVQSQVTIATALASLGCAIVFIPWNRLREEAVAKPSTVKLLTMWLVATTCLIPVYLIAFNSAHFFYRYAAPISVVSVPIVALVLAKFGRFRHQAVLFPVLLFSTFCVWATASLHSGNVGNSQTIAAGYVRTYYPRNRVASFQSGVVGFFNPNVENLDGKMNGAALLATRQHRLPEYLDKENVEVIVDWPSVIAAYLPLDYLSREWHKCPTPPMSGESVCLIRTKALNN